MIITVTLNAAIDKTYEISSFQLHQVNRTDAIFSEPGGKGINVAKILRYLESEVTASGIVGGLHGKQIVQFLDDINITHDFTHIAAESRLCLNVVESSGKQTEILESGPEVSAQDWETFKEKFQSLSQKSHIVVLSGSLPKGLSQTAYVELIQLARPYAQVIVDTSGLALEEAVAAQPFMIKPNEKEFSQLVGRPLHHRDDMIETLRSYHNHDIPLIVVTLGEKGALVAVSGEIYQVTPPPITAVNPVGSGDAFTAGMAFGVERAWAIEDTLRLAAAAGAANAQKKRAGVIDADSLSQLQSEIQIEKV